MVFTAHTAAAEVLEVAPGIGAGAAVQDMCSISVAGGKVDTQIDDPKDVHRKQSQLQLPVTLILVVIEGDETGLEAYIPGLLFRNPA